MSDSDLSKVSREQLSQMLDLDDGSAPAWSSAEYAVIYRHQLDAPLTADLVAEHLAEAGESLAERQDALQKTTFAEVLFHASPPVELLELIKQFAKRQGASVQQLPKEVAALLYLVAICAALVRCERRITSYDDGQLVRKIDWAEGCEWADDGSRELLQSARALLTGGDSA